MDAPAQREGRKGSLTITVHGWHGQTTYKPHCWHLRQEKVWHEDLKLGLPPVIIMINTHLHTDQQCLVDTTSVHCKNLQKSDTCIRPCPQHPLIVNSNKPCPWDTPAKGVTDWTDCVSENTHFKTCMMLPSNQTSLANSSVTFREKKCKCNFDQAHYSSKSLWELKWCRTHLMEWMLTYFFNLGKKNK